MATGIVKWFNNGKGFGFINSDDVQEDIFVHYSAIKMEGFRALYVNQAVTFEMQETKNGLMAQNVMPVENAVLHQ